jgi:hypothetical protein
MSGMRDIKRYGGFCTIENLAKIKEAAARNGVGMGGMLETLVLGLDPAVLDAAIANGKAERAKRPDRRKERQINMSKLRGLSSDKLEELVKLAAQQEGKKAA